MKNLSHFILVLCAVVSLSLAPTRPAEAAVGLVFKEKVTAITGGVLTAFGGGLYLVGINAGTGYAAAVAGTAVAFGGMVVGATALIVLEDEEQVLFQYNGITSEEAERLGLSSEEYEAYQADVYLINLLVDEVAAQTPEDVTAEEAAELWTFLANEMGLSEASRSALVKITSQFYQ